MKNIRVLGAALAASLLLVACGGGDDAKNTSPYGKLVVFGDSLSDSGTHATQGVVLGTTGGKYTVNGLGVQIWPELLASELGVAAPCAARVGLESDPLGPFARLGQAPVSVPGCYNYAQGGSRVTNPIGTWNKALLLLTPPDPTGYLGQLTEPAVTQVANHLAAATKFAADDLVTVMFGGNDVFMNLAAVEAGLPAPTAIGAMAQAGTELATLVKNEIIAKGEAKRVVVVNLPAFEVTPFFAEKDVSVQGLVKLMVDAFNGALAAGLAGVPEVLQVDAYALVKGFKDAPATNGLSNVTDRACDRAKAVAALLCSQSTTVAGDVSRYAFADDVHPTPYAHSLLKKLALDAIVAKGWR